MLITDEKIWDSDAFEAAVEGMCKQLEDFPFDRVAFWASSTPEVIFLFFAIWKMGKIACPLSPRFPSPYPFLARLQTELFTPRVPVPHPAKPWNFKEDNLATLLFTSGTTATPKIACHTLGNHLYNALGSNHTLMPLHHKDRWFLSLPLHHVGGIGVLCRCYLARASIVLSSKIEGVTHASLVPAQLKKFVLPPSLKYLLLGGAPLPQAEGKILPTYGMTETSSQIVTSHRLHPYAEMKIGQDGEIFVRGRILFKGYLDGESPFDKEGWFPTKDLGRWRDDRFEILGRKDNLFISGGENIQPEEIEQVLKKVLSLTEAVIVPISDPQFDARPVAFLDPYVDCETMKKALLPLLPKFKIPICSLPLPPQEGLKPNRQKLAEIGATVK